LIADVELVAQLAVWVCCALCCREESLQQWPCCS